MFRSGSAAVILMLLMGVSSTGSAQENDRFVSLRIAKTERFVSPFGDSSERNGAVVARLYRVRPSGDVLVATKRVEVEGDGSYRARFERPKSGECRVKVRLVGTQERDSHVFPCYIPGFGQGTATLSTLTTNTTIDALIADDVSERAYGLMYRPRMREDLGMAFLYDSPSSGGYWMKNTLIPLSIAFVDSNDVIIRILDMDPCVEDPCQSYDPGAPYQMALEVNQGAFAEWGIAEGDRIVVESD